MAYNFTSTQTWAVPGRAFSFLRDTALAGRAAVSAMINRYEAAHALSKFDRRMLQDIGLSPEDVNSAFSEPLWRDPTRRLAALAVERRLAARAARRAEQATIAEKAKLELVRN